MLLMPADRRYTSVIVDRRSDERDVMVLWYSIDICVCCWLVYYVGEMIW